MKQQGRKHYYACKRMRVLSYLKEHGFRYDFVLPDERNKDKVIWMFQRTDELTKALDCYFESRRLAKEGS